MRAALDIGGRDRGIPKEWEDSTMAKARRKRQTYTSGQRNAILAAARKEGLTALQVKRKFGVTPVTYYSWRKKKGLTRRRGSIGLVTGSTGNLTQHVQSEVRARVRQLMPGIVRNEVSGYLRQLFGGNGRGRTRKV
jgi:transposase-like protein